MAEVCPVIDSSGGATFQRHIVDVGDGDSATGLIYVADIHARSAIGRLCCPCRFRGQQGCPVINGTEAGSGEEHHDCAEQQQAAACTEDDCRTAFVLGQIGSASWRERVWQYV